MREDRVVAIYEIRGTQLIEHAPRDFAALDVWERRDLQALLVGQIDVLEPDLKVLAEEYGNWEDAKRRLDILALDRDGHLVVIELKRTNDGGHAELQALRYAAMISTLTFDDAVDAYAKTSARRSEADGTAVEIDARRDLHGFLGVPEDEEPILHEDVRIILVAADFGRELTTAVLWLNRFDRMDIRCVRLRPYDLDGRVLVNVEQIIPLREAADYQVRQRRKEVQRERVTADNRDWTRYTISVGDREIGPQNKRNSIRTLIEELVNEGVDPQRVAGELPAWAFRDVGLDSLQADDLRAAVAATVGGQPERYFLEHPIRHNGRTWVVSKSWGGASVERAMHGLVDAFPSLRVSFRAADSSAGGRR